MMLLKTGVRIVGLTPQIVLAAVIVHGILDRAGVACRITSGSDGKHADDSLHYCRAGKYTDGLCRAFDFGTHEYRFNKQALKAEVKAALGDDFDVVLEDEGKPNEHLHVEYDPK